VVTGRNCPPGDTRALAELPAAALETWAQAIGGAAAFLEQPIGLGVTLAKFAERALVDVDAVRSAAPGALVPRIRADWHEAIDMMLDALTLGAHTFGDQVRRFVTVKTARVEPAALGSDPAPDEAGGGSAVVVAMPGPVAPGEASERPMALANDSNRDTVEMRFSSSSLAGPPGARISGAMVSFDPPALAVEAGGTGRVVVRVQVPPGSPPGTYSGCVQGLPEGQQAQLRVEVSRRQRRRFAT
jgi:hypothetical protein